MPLRVAGPVTVGKVTLHTLVMKLKTPFTTSFGTIRDKRLLIAEAADEDGHSGFGEAVALPSPVYSEETVSTCEHVMAEFLIPLLMQAPLGHPDDVSRRFEPIRGNPMAKAALENAVWELYARRGQIPLSAALGGVKRQIGTGVSIGLQPSVEQLLKLVDGYVTEGYKRVKIKIAPGRDIDLVRSVRTRFPALPLMADANSAYTLKDADHLRRLDDYGLMMIEQPLAHDDIVDHARLQAIMRTPICLDESIRSSEDARKAIELGSCKIINIKIGRVGGLTEAKKIHDCCARREVPVWCGGMLETGIGRAHNIALSSLAGFVLPGDTAASGRYWERDIIQPAVEVRQGIIQVPEGPGIGYEVDREALQFYRTECKIFAGKSMRN